MPRQAGQIDQRKSEGILDAAATAFAERGLDAPMEEIARRAAVSKQTIYNHYGSKEDLLRALFERRREAVIEPLADTHDGEPLEDRLAAYLERMIIAYASAGYASVMRSAVAVAATRPEIGRLVYDAGPRIGRERIAEFLARESAAGRLDIDDAAEAADTLFGMAVGALAMRQMFDAPFDRDAGVIAARARRCAQRFLKAYAPRAA
jgi:AcrR family transcriptional regulator